MSDAPTQSLEEVTGASEAEVWTVQVLFSQREIRREVPRPVPAELVVGRRPGASGLGLDDGRVSRQHAVLRRKGDVLSIADQQSHNGTVVNGMRVERAVLADGDLLRLGDSLLLVRRSPVDLAAPELDELRGGSPAVRRLRAELALFARATEPVLVLGESGAGKGAAVRALHRLSGASGPLIAFNCTAIAESLAEATLFGHRAGAFTGARRDEPGLIRAAAGGTLFIDEIGDMPAALQPKLLRFLDEGAVRSVGATEEERVAVRVVAATHVDLVHAVKDGRFRGDLYARLAGLIVRIPPLRERREDILPLLGDELGREAAKITPDLAEALILHRWPFNVREVQRIGADLRLRGPGLTVLGKELLASRLAEFDEEEAAEERASKRTPSRDELVVLLRRHEGVVTRVAEEAGRSKKQVYRWLAKHGLNADEYRK